VIFSLSCVYSWPELSVGWVDSRVGLGREWVENLCFSGLGWVMGLKWQMCEKYMSCIFVTLCRVSTGKFVLWKLFEIFILCPLGMGWVGSWVHKFTWQWVGLGQLFGGLGWVGSMKIDPRTTLLLIVCASFDSSTPQVK